MTVQKWLRVCCAIVFLATLIVAGSRLVAAQIEAFGISVEANPQIFATMCALDAAGFDADESTLSEMPERLALRGDLLKIQGPAAESLRQFYRDHALANPPDTLSRYITFSLAAGPPPTFEFEMDRELLPPDVLAIDGFQGVLAAFYREARLDVRWAKIQPEYEPLVERYRPPVRKIVTVTDAYLREVERPSTGRSFTVYVEPLVGARTNFRNFGDKYDVVVGPYEDSRVEAIQHAFLHFKLDPLVLRYRPAIDIRRDLLNVAGRAPRLPDEYRSDFVSFTDECLIKAVELRLRHLTTDQLEAEMKEADEDGFILVRPFLAGLLKFEKDQPAMTYYFPDLMANISVDAEQQRFKNFAFAAVDAGPALGLHGAVSDAEPSELDRWLAEGDRELARKDIATATATFQKVLGKYPDEPRGLYGLAISSVMSGDADDARTIFEKIVALQNSPSGKSLDPGIVAWSHVYLGRMHDLADERDDAVNDYRAALAVEGAPEAARTAAQSGADAPYKAPQRPGGDQQPK